MSGSDVYAADLIQKGYKRGFCPYRICPLGAHVDHQNGIVTGFAIDRGVEIFYKPNSGTEVKVSSMNFEGEHTFSVDAVPPKRSDWADYLRGAALMLGKRFKLEYGMEAVLNGMLPVGGLSSSAAVTIAFIEALCDINGISAGARELIDIAQETENVYVGVRSGRLDQSCEVYCRKNNLLLLDFATGSAENIPNSPSAPAWEIAIIFSGVERALAGSGYNTRVDELKAAAYALKAYASLEYGGFEQTRLRDVPEEIFERYKDRLPENWRKRAQHYYSECSRVKKGSQAWREGDISAFGRLVFESGESSIELYEAGSPELIKLYEIMLRTNGIYGGRFSGAGFKGCCMALTNPSERENIAEKIKREYIAAFPALADKFDICFCGTSDGISAL